MSSFMNSTVPVPCSECGASIRVQIHQMRNGSTVRCPRGHRVELRIDANMRRELDRADRAERDLRQSVKDLERQLRRLR